MGATLWFMVTCPSCASEDLRLVGKLPDGRRHIACEACGHDWTRGEAQAPVSRPKTIAEHRAAFEQNHQMTPRRREQVETLKATFLARNPEPLGEVADYWARYQQIFSPEGLAACVPSDLKDFANNGVGAHPGNMSVFNTAWNELGDEEAAKRTRRVIEYLLHGPVDISIEDRLTDLIEGRQVEMRGFKEALLTRVLCVMYPDRFLPILIYSSPNGGKKEIARQVLGLELPEARAQSRSIGRLILWSNDLIVDHVGPGFAHMQHLSSFLWWAKDVVPQSSEAGNGRAVNHTGKYRELWRWLRDQRGDEVQTTFSAVEAVLGIPLPPSAREYVAHWHGYEGSALARAIKDAGWRSSHVDLALGTVVFVREHD